MKFTSNAVISLLLVVTVTKHCEGQIAQALRFIFYSNAGSQQYGSSDLTDILSNKNFDNSKTTLFYFYGFTHTPNTTEVVGIRNAYLKSGTFNFILFDIKPVLYTFYYEEQIGVNVAKTIVQLLKAGLNLSKLELVGFSLGAQIAGYVARNINSNSSHQYIVPRVVGLEPAKLSKDNLKKGDASFVMTMHTETVLGEGTSIGDVNFVVNGGIIQPMCGGIVGFVCSHGQSQLYWMEAVLSKSSTIFPARKCDSYNQFMKQLCNQAFPIGYMNPMTSNTLSGNYYLNTNTKSPFALPTADPKHFEEFNNI